jgi:hypothetical protein
VQGAEAKRSQTYPTENVRTAQLQPRRYVNLLWLIAHSYQHTDRSGKSPNGRGEDQPAGVVEPLQIVNRKQQRGLQGQCINDRHKSRRHGPLIRGRTAARRPTQDPIDGESLRRRQFHERGIVQTHQKVGNRRVRQH